MAEGACPAQSWALALEPTSSVALRATQSTPTDSPAPSWPSRGGCGQAGDRWFLSGCWEGQTQAGVPALQTLLDLERLLGQVERGAETQAEARRPAHRPACGEQGGCGCDED